MDTPNDKKWTEESYLKNETKAQNQLSKNKVNTTLEKPATNESGIIAKKRGWQ